MIIIDEAQNLSSSLLEEIRLLSNLETDKSKLLQIVLLGQPELNVMLGRPELEQLRQRIAIHTHINPLDRDETEAYIRHRLKVAGNENAVIFQDEAMDAVYAYSRGIPRLINVTCDYLLLAAYADGSKVIDKDLVREITEDLTINRPEIREVSMGTVEAVTPEIYAEIKLAVSAMDLRLRNLEAAVNKMLKKEEVRQGRAAIKIEKTGEGAGVPELLHHEFQHLKKEDMVMETEENIRHLFE